MTEIGYSNLRRRLASVFDRVCDDQEVVLVRRPGHKDVAIIAADELTALTKIARLQHPPIKTARAVKAKRIRLN